MKVPICFLCNKRLFNREKGECEGGRALFAEYVREDVDSEDAGLDEPPGVEWFCDEHLPAAEALSHLTSQEALIQLEQQFGKFAELAEEPDPPRTRWQRLCDWWRWL